MLNALFPLLYLSLALVLLVQAFRMMRPSPTLGMAPRRSGDRTGLRTTHPELLDSNGMITQEELLVVRFPDLDQPETLSV